MKLDRKRELSRLIEKEHIHFHELEDVRPGHHKQVFGAIRELGQYRFENYSPPFTYEAHQKPWRARLKAHVQRIVSLAEACRREQQNEYGWRLRLEHEIFARFGTEVTCKRCSCRLWRSEVEVLLNPSDTYGNSLDLEQRQSTRRPCTCRDFERHMDSEDPGVCRIFHDRADVAVRYTEHDSIAKLLPAEQRPDRVFGYHETSRFNRLLDQRSTLLGSDDQDIRDLLECSPFDEPRDQVLFPFLVLESKSESGDSFDSVEIQTAFSIKKLLDIQHRLKLAAGTESQWESGPLVWFLSNRGDEWRVAAAYPDLEGASPVLHYHIFHLWSGSVRSKDSALQLSLIMDYIWDWARDSHREAILGELRVLTGRTGSSFYDSDVYSLVDRVVAFCDDDLEQRVLDEGSQEDGPDYSRELDSDQIVFRSISGVRARLSALYLTKGNISPLLSSFVSSYAARTHATNLQRLLVEAWKVTPEALEALELMWTGRQRDDPDFDGAATTLYAVFNVRAYFAQNWEQVLELTYIAITQDALEQLQAFAKAQNPIHFCPSELPTVRQEHLVGWFRFFRQSRPRVRFHAAMRRACFSSRHRREKNLPHYRITAEERVENGVHFDFETIMLPDSMAKPCQIVDAAYKQCKRGRREPDEPFLRISSSFDTVCSDNSDIPSVWDLNDCPVSKSALHVVLFPTGSRCAHQTQAAYCIYLMDDIPGPQSFQFPADVSGLVSFRLPECYPSAKVWNLRPDTNFAPDQGSLQKFRTESVALMDATNNRYRRAKGNHSVYHVTKEALTPVQKRNPKAPKAQWMLHMSPPKSPNESIQAAAEHAAVLVASRTAFGGITYLYSTPDVSTCHGLRSESTHLGSEKEQKKLRKKIMEEGMTMGALGIEDREKSPNKSTRTPKRSHDHCDPWIAIPGGGWRRLSDRSQAGKINVPEPPTANISTKDTENLAQHNREDEGGDCKRPRLQGPLFVANTPAQSMV